MAERIAGLGKELSARLIAGDRSALLEAFACLARGFLRSGGLEPQDRDLVSLSMVVGGLPVTGRPASEAQRALVAAGCDLCDVLRASPEGRQVLDDLVGAVPIAQ